MITVDWRQWGLDIALLALTFLLAAGVSHHYNKAHGDTCGAPNHAEAAQSH